MAGLLSNPLRKKGGKTNADKNTNTLASAVFPFASTADFIVRQTLRRASALAAQDIPDAASIFACVDTWPKHDALNAAQLSIQAQTQLQASRLRAVQIYSFLLARDSNWVALD